MEVVNSSVQKRVLESRQAVRYANYKNSLYPFIKKSGRKGRLRGKSKDRAFLKIKCLIENGVTSTSGLAKRLGRSTRQVRRYLKEMAVRRMICLNGSTGRLVCKKTGNILKTREGFEANRTISKWVEDCIARKVKPSTIQAYTSAVRLMFRLVEVDPRKVVSSKISALKFWAKFMVEYTKKNPTRGNHRYRTGFKNFLASYDIAFAPRMGKTYGLSSLPDNYGRNVGVSFTPEMTEEISRMMLQEGDLKTYLWWRIGLRSGSRNKAISRMVWERIYLDEKNDESMSLRLEQHETKDPRGHWFLGENGEWKTKYVPLEIRDLLLKWRSHSDYGKFLWFEDSHSDEQNRRNAKRAAAEATARLKSYYERVKGRIDPHTREYMLKRPTHIMRHTLVQQMKNADLTDKEIADMFGWRTPSIIGGWYAKMSERKRKELAARCSSVVF